MVTCLALVSRYQVGSHDRKSEPAVQGPAGRGPEAVPGGGRRAEAIPAGRRGRRETSRRLLRLRYTTLACLGSAAEIMFVSPLEGGSFYSELASTLISTIVSQVCQRVCWRWERTCAATTRWRCTTGRGRSGSRRRHPRR